MPAQLMKKIVLTTFNAKFSHASFGLRYLQANLGELQKDSILVELTTKERPADAAERILRHDPKIVGIGVYIWNALETEALVSLLKKIAPSVTVVLGGPEVSYETEEQTLSQLADYVIRGEGEVAFQKLCASLLRGKRPLMKVLGPDEPELEALSLPYDLYTDADIEQRVVYVEASRGCPFRCEFCLSALDKQVRPFPLELFLESMAKLFQRGVRQFKFVDRTFNLSAKTSLAILEFFLELYEPGLFVHFEMVPDRLPVALREVIARFPPGALQFEIGIQTFDEQVSKHISRRQDLAKTEENLTFLRNETGVHLHTDLIIGLPGEDLDTFAKGFDRLVALRPHEIQVGILKRLRGAPIRRHSEDFEMVFSDQPPYDILKNKHLDFATLQRLKRFAAVWDTLYNSGHFKWTVESIWGSESPFYRFLRFSDWVFAEIGRTHAVALDRWFELLKNYRIDVLSEDREVVIGELEREYVRPGRVRIPRFLRTTGPRQVGNKKKGQLPRRQARHLIGAGLDSGGPRP